ncbi:transcriptional regulator Kaiso-like [Bombina bombina]|uniref:transcriptional regulator Kaiso-like n=1 Tax=Bombina bombina TaxID=8345 RepID=UPI00235A5436|nr:transcriptional regulator Kaiso-like [Bombina bombina]XP_053555269.1 transcriptional regulator Kaiso-like [Bombina bombina]
MEGKKLITATDTQYSGNLLQALNDQRLHGLFCDVTVIVEDRKFKAHKNILSACSTYFHQLFSLAGQVVELNFVRAEIFAEILNYIYSAKIVRVKYDMLEELIKSGKLLGVPFIAELGIPLSQVKSISGGVKDSDAHSANSDQKVCEPQNSAPASLASKTVTKLASVSEMPVISEAFTMSSEEFKNSKDSKVADDSKINDSDDDVIFCSETVSAKPASDKKEVSQSQAPTVNDHADSKTTVKSGQTPSVQNTKPVIQPTLKNATLSQKHPVTVNATINHVQAQHTNGAVSTPATLKPVQANIVVPSQNPLHPPSLVAIAPQITMPSTVNFTLPKLQQGTFAAFPKTELVLNASCIATPVVSSVNHLGKHFVTQKNVSFDGVQKKQVVTFTQESSSKPGEFKIKISDVVSGSSREGYPEPESQRIKDGKKVITLDTASEIEGLSTGCKVYANIGEDTYDIVIPIKEDPDDAESKLDEVGLQNRKRMKLKHDDHYELIVDGRVYYICIVCKRSYVCLTSLRRHFNVHSWEKKYPCRYCERVFPLAEYRTKHEIHHTGERRYQCLTCGNSFINYQVMASHIRSAHSLDPAGDSKLYRLNPCKTLQIRQYAYINNTNHNNSPVINDGGIVYNIDPDKSGPASEDNSNSSQKPVNWDDIFIQPTNQNVFKPNTSDGGTEFEFVIPESY